MEAMFVWNRRLIMITEFPAARMPFRLTSMQGKKNIRSVGDGVKKKYDGEYPSGDLVLSCLTPLPDSWFSSVNGIVINITDSH